MIVRSMIAGLPKRWCLAFGVSAGVMVCALLAGCGPSQQDMEVFLESHRHVVSSGEYRVAPPDMIHISATLASEIDGETQRVRSDGKISLRLLGEVKVAGLTPKQIAAKLEEMLARYYVGARVNIHVTDTHSKKYYVFGQVSSPGPQPYSGRDTLLDALARAQPTFLAQRDRIKVTRPSPTPGEQRQFTVDLDKMIRSGDTRCNVLLAEGDIVYVPPTPLAWVGLRMRELLYPIGPAMSIAGQPVYAKNLGRNWDEDDSDD